MRDFFTPPTETNFQAESNDTTELLKAWALTSLAFAIHMIGGNFQFIGFLPKILAISALTCGIGFVLHELAHRYVARYFGAEAHFIAETRWLLLSVALAFLGWFIAAPGAVWHRGYLTKQQSGLIALAGPVANLLIALSFLLLSFFVGKASFWLLTIQTGYQINAWLGLFNLIPAGPFDGAKVYEWNPIVFGVTAVLAGLMVYVLPGFLSLSF